MAFFAVFIFILFRDGDGVSGDDHDDGGNDDDGDDDGNGGGGVTMMMNGDGGGGDDIGGGGDTISTQMKYFTSTHIFSLNHRRYR